MKNATRKLIPALAMLLISAVMMSTASFAWFSMSTTVSTTGMKVQATTSKNLMISDNSTSDFGAKVDFNTSMDRMVPCSTVGGNTTAPSFYKIHSVGTGMSQDRYESAPNTTFIEADDNTDYLKTTVYIKCVGESATNLSAKIVATGSNKALDPALRVMLVVDGKTYIYTPVAGAEYGIPGQAVAGTGDTQLKQLGAITKLVTGDAANYSILDTLAKDTPYQVDIYVWYEGEDVNCTASNAVDLASTSFTINFTVAN